MAAKSRSLSEQKKSSSFITHLVLIILCLIWFIPVFGVFVTSFRNSTNVFNSGWWRVFPHQEWQETGEIKLDSEVDVNGDIEVTLPNSKTISGTFDTFKSGVNVNGIKVQWYGAKRTRTLKLYEKKWVGFESNLTLENYKNVLTGKKIQYTGENGETLTRNGSDLGSSFLNSITVTVPATIIPILIAAFAAYGFAWLNFPGRKLFFSMVVAMMVVPLQIAIVPVLSDLSKVGLSGQYLGIWMAHTGFGLPLAIYLLFNYISTIPREILESAFIDGASNFTIFTRLILPLSVPSIASFGIFQFLWVWNDYLVSLVILGGGQKMVITQALANIVGTRGQDWHLLTAGAFVSMIVPLIVFLSLQRYFVRGMMAGSVKG